jgi:host factor-I protein
MAGANSPAKSRVILCKSLTPRKQGTSLAMQQTTRRHGLSQDPSRSEDGVSFSNRSHEDGNGRKAFRAPITDFRRSANQSARPARPAPPEVTNAENFYYLKQMEAKTPMVIVMTDGEEIRGWIEWYDRACLKVNREGAPNLLIQKRCVKYLFKEDELGQR